MLKCSFILCNLKGKTCLKVLSDTCLVDKVKI